MPTDGFRYAIEFYTEDWVRLGRQGVVVDLEPARECARLQRLRGGRSPAGVPSDPGRIVPRWSQKLGEPYLDGFRVETDDGEEPAAGAVFPNTYFLDVAQCTAARYVREGLLSERDPFFYLVLALPAETEAPAPAGGALAPASGGRPRLTVRRSCAPLAIVESPLAQMREEAREEGEPHGSDVPVFVPENLLQEAKRLCREAGAAETGGVLIGHLHLDRTLPELFVEVTAQVPARFVEAGTDRLTFTPETWHDVDATIAQRASGELHLGWWHTHPVGQWASGGETDEPKRRVETNGFLSTLDRLLHRTVFPSAYCVALVVTDPGDTDPTCALFGWRQGVVVRRGYHVRTGGAHPPRSLDSLATATTKRPRG